MQMRKNDDRDISGGGVSQTGPVGTAQDGLEGLKRGPRGTGGK